MYANYYKQLNLSTCLRAGGVFIDVLYIVVTVKDLWHVFSFSLFFLLFHLFSASPDLDNSLRKVSSRVVETDAE